ncbi:hypothetical protein [Nostoc sp.]|uniref:hypothetical protein n=1 Tax=Nostoc sp. TaxID=1180 RepID=UPI002FFBA50A
METGQLIVRDGSQILANTFGEGKAGNLTVLARDSVELIGTSADNRFPSGLFTSSEEGATGDGGKLTVETERLIVRDGAQIGAGTLGNGDGSSLIVSASDSAELIGRSADGRRSSGLFTSVGSNATGDGGKLTVETGRLIVRDGAQIRAGTLGEGAAGNLTVIARSVELDNQASITTTATSGNGGNITL